MSIAGLDSYLTAIPTLHDVPEPNEMTDCIYCREPIIDDNGKVKEWDCYVETVDNSIDWSYWHVGCNGKPLTN